MFCTFWLGNVLRATTVPAGSAPAALASLLFDPPEPQMIGKTQCFAALPPFRAPGSSFFWFFLFLLLFSDSSHRCFSSAHIVGSLTSKFPSITEYIYIFICIYMCVCIAIDNLPSVNIYITYDNSREKLLHKGLYASLIISVLPSTYLYLKKSVLEVHREACVGGTPTPCRSNLHFTPSHGGALGLHQVLCCRGRGRKFRLAIEHAAGAAMRWSMTKSWSTSSVVDRASNSNARCRCESLKLRFWDSDPRWFIYPHMIGLSPMIYLSPSDISHPVFAGFQSALESGSAPVQSAAQLASDAAAIRPVH